MRLGGKTALITGSCGRGMGRSTALRLARDGANVVLNYGTHRRGPEMQAEMQARAHAIAEAIVELGSRAIVQEADTRDEQQIKAMVEAACKEFGQVDILVNNAGGDWVMDDYTKLDLGHWKDVLAAEIDGAFLTMKYTVPGMRARRWGRVVHIGLEGVDCMRAPAPSYCLGKAARSWMAEAFGPREIKNGVTMNCIEPGLTPGLSLEDAVRAARGEHLNSEITALRAPDTGEVMRTWRGPWAERPGPVCHDVAELIAFLCSGTARFVSGQVISLPHFPARILRAAERR